MKLIICILLALNISNIGWAATISPTQQTLMENMASLFAGLNFTAEAVMSTTPSTGEQSFECRTINEAYGCLHSATLEVFGILLSPGFMSSLSDSRTSFCQAYGRYTNCSEPHLAGCPLMSTVLFHLIPGFFELLCSPAGYDQFINLLPCLTNYQFALQVEQCGKTIPSVVTETDLCRVPDGYTTCLVQAAYTACSIQAEANLDAALGFVFRPFKEAVCPNSTAPTLNAETTTADMTLEEGSTGEEEVTTTTVKTTTLHQHITTIEEITTTTAEEPTTTTAEEPTTTTTTTTPLPSPPFQCYECSSGAPGYWQNLACPANGKLKDWARQTYTCNGPCVTRITRWPLGDVVRSCSSNYYFTFPVPANGCRRENDSGIVCFCSGDRCNDANMLSQRAKLMKEFGQ